MPVVSDFSAAFLQGFATSAGLIVAIGAQNAFVLTQGLVRRHHWPIAALCSLIDALLILTGVLGAGLLFERHPALLQAVTLGGLLFLLLYGARALRAALRGASQSLGERRNLSLRAALLTTLALSLLNPHVYLDTLVLLGAIGGRYPGEAQGAFALGAMAASSGWFFALGLAARWLAPLFARPAAWRVLDLGVCLLMWSVALALWQSLPALPRA